MLKEKIRIFLNKNFVIIEEEYWSKLQHKMLIENIFRIRTASFLGLLFMLFTLFIDFMRFQEGKLIVGSIYWKLFMLHLSIIFISIPLLLIEFYKKKIIKGTFAYGRQIVMLWLIIVAAVLMIMGAFSILDRGSILLYVLYILLANFVLVLFHPDRTMLNLVSFVVFMIMIYMVHPNIDQRFITYLLECMVFTLVAFALSTHIYNLMVKEVTTEQRLIQQKEEVEKAQKESNRLLLNILPESVAKELIQHNKVQPRNYNAATVMMIDFVGFSKVSKTMSSTTLVETLDYAFTQLDRIIKKYDVEKIKTIGDGYLCVGGIPTENNTHPQQVIRAALEIIAFLNNWKEKSQAEHLPFFEGRIGIHTGSLTAGVVGESKFAYDIWGDTVNIAARLESSSLPGKINISEQTYMLVKDLYIFEKRGSLPIKNLGEIEMWFVSNEKMKLG